MRIYVCPVFLPPPTLVHPTTMRALLVLLGSMVSTAAGYRFPIRVTGKSPPSWVPSGLEWLWWLEEFHHACSTLHGDVRRRWMAIWLEATGHVPWGQRTSFEELVSSPDAEAAIKRELRHELDAGAQRLYQLDDERRQLEEQGALRGAEQAWVRYADLMAALEPHSCKLREYTYASWPKHHHNPAWQTQKLADELRLEDAVYAQRWATFKELRKAGKDRAAAEVWNEICEFKDRRIALDLHFAQVMGKWEAASKISSYRKDCEAGLPPGTTVRLERCLEG